MLVLRYFEDLPETEIAAIMGCSVGTVRSLAHRALTRLRELSPVPRLPPGDDMTNELLGEVLHRIADRAEPFGGLAEKAIRRAARRRRILTASALGTAAAVAVPFLFLGGGDDTRSVQPLAPPRSLSDEQSLVDACLRHGSPTGGMGEPHRLPEKGGPSDFRIPASTKAGAETVASVGSPQGFVLCAVRREANTEPPFVLPLAGGRHDLRVDAVRGLTIVGEDGRGSSALGLHHLVTGRFKPGVTRIEVEEPQDDPDVIEGDGDDPEGDAEREPLGPTYRIKDERVLSITAFGSAGEVVQSWKAPGRGLREFDSSRCPYSSGRPALCSD